MQKGSRWTLSYGYYQDTSDVLCTRIRRQEEESQSWQELTDTDYQEEVGLLLHNDSREEYVCYPGDTLGHLLVYSYTQL